MTLPYFAVVLLVLATVYAALVAFRQKPEGEAYTWLFPDGTRRSARILAGIATLIFVIGCGLVPHEYAGYGASFLAILDSRRL